MVGETVPFSRYFHGFFKFSLCPSLVNGFHIFWSHLLLHFPFTPPFITLQNLSHFTFSVLCWSTIFPLHFVISFPSFCHPIVIAFSLYSSTSNPSLINPPITQESLLEGEVTVITKFYTLPPEVKVWPAVFITPVGLLCTPLKRRHMTIISSSILLCTGACM